MNQARKSTMHMSRSYDVIFIGQLGAVVAHHFLKHSSMTDKCLVINHGNSIVEPSLSTIYSQKIKITRHAPDKCDLQTKEITHIKPLLRQIEMQSGTVYYYRYLVFGENNWADLDFIPRLRQALSNQYSLVYSNWCKTDLSKIYKHNTGNLVFYIPKGKHAGYENYNFLAVYSRFLQSGQKIHNNFRCKVILEGISFFPHNQIGDEFIKRTLRDNGVEIIENTCITNIDYMRRRLTLNQKNELQYTIFYCVLPQKTPQLLIQADIDPYSNHPKTLQNKSHKNIFIFGADLFPTTHSFTAINYQAHIIRHNLINSLMKKQEMACYEGQTIVKFWLNQKETVTIQHDYQTYEEIASNCLFNFFSFLSMRTVSYYEVQLFYNLGSDGAPFYFLSPNFVDCKAGGNNQQEQKNSHRGLKSTVNIENAKRS